MPATTDQLEIVEHAPIRTWFGVGGGARRLAIPSSIGQLYESLDIDARARILGDGANLLVDDGEVRELVVSTERLTHFEIQPNAEPGAGRVIAHAGANLPKLVIETTRLGLAGLEGLGGVPASIGGAVVMNAGGSFGQIADSVDRVSVIDRRGRQFTLKRNQIAFGYRTSGLNNLVIASVELRLPHGDPVALRQQLKTVMRYKAERQPMADRSAGCVFKNPTLHHDLDGIGERGERVSAGRLIDRAGCKGLRSGGASVSPVHANFIVTEAGATAGQILDLMSAVQARVLESFGVRLHPEIAIWSDRHRPDTQPSGPGAGSRDRGGRSRSRADHSGANPPARSGERIA